MRKGGGMGGGDARVSEPIAIVGMAGRFPGARNVAELWHNLREGRETIRHFSEAELAAVEHAFDEVRGDPGFVRARGVLDDVEMFDAAFFGFRPREAMSLDPQQRVWFETAWEALEDAGIAPGKFRGEIGVFAGGGYLDTYLLHNLARDRDFVERLVRLRAVDSFQNIINNDKDFLPTRTSFLFDLTGPSVNVQTACSTSLVSVVMAAQSLVLGESDACIAGGISIQLPQVRGYLAQDGGMDSSDGHVRPFDARADGTVFGNGVGAVVLRRLSDALRDGDRILAILKGFAVNNDGANRSSYTAPSLEGQMSVVRRAIEMSGVSPEAITYVEAHGTGTSVGDPVEVDALSRVFREWTAANGFCGIGSIKSNVGHLDSASGVAGLIKTILAMQHREIPPSINFETPNPKIDFERSPFFVVSSLRPWTTDGTPRAAGISSFGVGGTNAHVVVVEAPEVPAPGPAPAPGRPAMAGGTAADVDGGDWQLITLSARSPEALVARADQLARHLESSDAPLAQVSYSLATGREDMPERLATVVRDRADAVRVLRERSRPRVVMGTAPKTAPETNAGVVFLFPGQGSQSVEMGRDLYRTEPVFRDAVDVCSEALEPRLGLDLRTLLFPAERATKGATKGASESATESAAHDAARLAAAERLNETRFTQPALFTIEYASARLLISWGITPAAMIGHSIGDFVAACLSGVFPLEVALELVARRGEFMQACPRGDMLAVRLPEGEIRSLLSGWTESGPIEIAAANAPTQTVVSGDPEAIRAFARLCESRGVQTHALNTSHAFHSASMDPAVVAFQKTLTEADLHPPGIPFVSSRTGTWITDAEATDPAFWARQLRDPVLFRKGAESLAERGSFAFIEVGPGAALSSFVRQTLSGARVVTTLGRADDERPDRAKLLEAVGHLWLGGAEPDWGSLFDPAARRRVPLPVYPFQRQRFWVDPPLATTPSGPGLSPSEPWPFTAGSPQESPMIVDNPPPAEPAGSRIPRIREALSAIFEDLSGLEVAGGELTFLEMGFDSLFLTQIATALQNEFGVRIKFRRMLEDLCTLDLLSEFFDAELPPERFAAPPPAPRPLAPPAAAGASAGTMPYASLMGAALPLGAAVPANASAVERLVHQQLAVMAQQLAALTGGHPLAGAPTPGAPSGVGSTPTAGTDEPGTKAARPAKPFGAQTRINTSRDASFTPRQRERFDAFAAGYLAKTRSSKEFTQRARRVLADPRAVTGFQPLWKELVYPIVVDRSKGCRLWDLDGNEYVDITCGFGSNFLGNQPDFITRAIHEQVDRGYEVGPQHPLTVEVAELISELTGMERVAFCNTGSEAVVGAMRQARTITGRKLVAVFTNSYHGIVDEVIVRGTPNLRSLPAAPGIPQSAVENLLVLEYDDPKSLQILRERGSELAAIMAEPVQSRNPRLQPRAFLHELRRIADEVGCALIFDEVITGFRIAPGGAQEHFGVRADLATYGKIIGGGLPFAAIAGTSRFMDALDGGQWQYGDDSTPEVGVTYFAGTFVRHPLALAAAKASLLHLKSEGPELQRRLNERTTRFAEALNAHFREVGAPISIDHFGSLCRVTVSEDEPFGTLLYYWLRDRGVHAWDGRGCFLTTAHTDEDIQLILDAFKSSVADLQDAGLLSSSLRHDPDPGGPGGTNGSGGMSEGRVPLTDAQREIWYASQMGDVASSAYNESFTLEIAGALDVPRFREAVEKVTLRHEAIHLRFAPDGTGQTLTVPTAPDLPLVDLSGSDPASANARIAEVLVDHATRPFDLELGPLIRNELYRIAPELHLFVSTAHHIVFDGWSAGVYIEEIARTYEASSNGKEPDLPPAPRFSEYARAEEEAVRSPEGQEALAYWKRVFATPPEPLDLPSDRPRPAIKSYRGASVHWEFRPDTYEKARSAAARNHTTLYTLLLATYAAYLHRLTGQADLVVGVPTAGQALSGEYSLIGHCVNILPLRSRTEPAQSFAAFLKVAAKDVLDAQDHQPATLGAILRTLKLARTPGRSPLVEVIFNLNRKLPSEEMSGLRTRIREVEKRAINWDMFLNCSEEDGRLTTELDYNTDLFDAGTIRALLEGFETMLRAVSDDASTRIEDLPVQSAEAVGTLLALGTGARIALPERMLPALVDEVAARQPSKRATGWEGEGLTYAELVSLSDRVARHLRAKGVAPGRGVGLLLSRTPALPAILLGVMKAGAWYVPLDPRHPATRLDHILRDAGIDGLVLDRELGKRFGAFPGITVYADELEGPEALEGPSGGAPIEPDSIARGDTAYVIYTSGSTGLPKGVRVSHGALLNLLVAMATRPGLDESDVLLAVTTLTFDIAGLELYLPLLVGATVLVAPDDLAEEAGRLAAAIEGQKVTTMQATPSHWRLLFDGGWRGATGLRALVGGEAFPADLAERLVRGCAEVWNVYGPTETTIWSTCQRVVEAPAAGSVPIGVPIANTDVYLVDERMRLVPRGVPGELVIGGAGLADGYVNLPEATDERFIGGVPEATSGRVYRTGDFCRWRKDGTLEFLGRRDDQVKIRGFRVELGEVESALSRHEAVRRAVAVRREDRPGDVRLVAYVTLEDGASIGMDDLRSWVRDALPEYMRPQHLIEMEEIPLTANGKVDRRALPEPGRGSDGGSVAPANDLERAILGVWLDVLGLEHAGTTDNFFDLGGHSILATRIVNRLQEIEPAVALRDIFEAPTVAELSLQVDALRSARAAVALTPPSGADREELVF